MSGAFSTAFDTAFGGDTTGPIAPVVDSIVERVAELVHGDADDPWIVGAVDAAVVYVKAYTNRESLGLPDDDLTVNGLVGFATRIYLDALSPNGAQVAVGDPTFAPVFQPEHLYKHWRHYFMRLNVAWGVG